MKEQSTGRIRHRYWLITGVVGMVLLLEGCGMMGLGHMGIGYPVVMERSERGFERVAAASSAGIGVELDVPPLRMEKSSILTVRVYEAESGVLISDALVRISVRRDPADLAPARSTLDPGTISLASLGSPVSGFYQFLLTPRDAGSHAIEATIYSSPYNIDRSVSLRMVREVPDDRVSRRRRQWFTGVAVVGGLSMMAAMVIFMGEGHDHGY